MIHKFRLHGKNIVLDVNSGAIHVVDDLVYKLLDNMDVPVCVNEEQEAYDEIMRLKEEGLLFSPDYDAPVLAASGVKALCLHVAHDCNLRCGYCFADTGDYSHERELMSLEVGKKAIDFVIERSGNRRNIEIDFFGGEPLMNFDVVRGIVEYARGKRGKNFRFTITTNGLLLDDDKMAFINENMDNIVLSLDGRREVNDNMRKTISGDGSYDLILNKLQRAAESRGGKDYYMRGTFTRYNLNFLEDVRHIVDLGFKSVSVEPVVGPDDSDYVIREEDLPAVFEEYEKLAKEYDPSRYTFFHFVIDPRGGPCVAKRVSGCGAGGDYLAVTPSGDVYPCHQFVDKPEFQMGDLWNFRPGFKTLNVEEKPECGECWAKYYCSGGCHASQSKIGCEMQRKRTECAIYCLCKESSKERHC